jgi:hypothetical protein
MTHALPRLWMRTAALTGGALLLLAHPVVAAPAKAPAPAPAKAAALTEPAAALPYPAALVLVRSALIAVQQANETGDYSVLSALGGREFNASNPPEKLAQSLAPLRNYNLASVLITEPRFTQPPMLDAKGLMTMEGFFLSEGYRISFRLAYGPQSGRWRLAGLAAGVAPITPPAAPK